MAVDLSKVGLTGIEFAYDRRKQAADTEAAQELTRKARMENDQAEHTQAIEQESLKRLHKIAAGESNGGDPARGLTGPNRLQRLGELMVEGGAPQRGKEYLTAAMELRSKESDMRSEEQTRQTSRLDNIVKVGNLFSQTVGTARNDAEYRWGLQRLRDQPDVVAIFGEENLAALENMEFDEAVVAKLNEEAITAYQRADLELRTLGLERQIAADGDANQRHAARLALDEARLRETRMERERKEKADGATPSNAPTAQQLTSARTTIANLVYDGVVPPEGDPRYVAFQAGAHQIASEASQLVKDIPGISYQDAITRATLEAITRGDWQDMEAADDRNWLQRTLNIGEQEPVKAGKYRGPGQAAADAVALPMADGKVNASALTDGTYYRTERGIFKWNAERKRFVKD